jgi:predicted GNAT family acetyltransferase
LTDPSVVVDAERSRFESVVDGHTAFIDFRRDGDTIVLIHTEVPDELEGHGVGSALVRGALEHIRAERLALVPQCPFVRSYIERHPDEAAGIDVRPV